MGADEFDAGDLKFVVQVNYEPILVAGDIEDHAVVSEKTPVAISVPNLLSELVAATD